LNYLLLIFRFELYAIMPHIPVLLEEAIAALDPKPNENFIDGTFGKGGHSKVLLEKTAPHGIVIGLDWDNESLEGFKREQAGAIDSRLILENLNFARMGEAAALKTVKKIDGILLDLGMSSWHVDESKKGFSFLKDELLDMRYDSENLMTAARIVNESSGGELERILKDYGEEKMARKIASEIVKARSQKKIETTSQLTAVIARIARSPQRIPSFARIFQALRIAVNHEFENIVNGLGQGFGMLAPGGRMAVITFHSLEDRIVKIKFREWETEGRARLINGKPIVPQAGEMARNPRSRSAKLRAIEKINQ
jgi:16S rRNA (cytosine1402-N4)-methyltransferase